MKERQFTTTVLNPEEGMFLTQSADVHISQRVFATEVSIGENSSSSDWIEIDETQKQAYVAEFSVYDRSIKERLNLETDYANI